MASTGGALVDEWGPEVCAFGSRASTVLSKAPAHMPDPLQLRQRAHVTSDGLTVVLTHDSSHSPGLCTTATTIS